MEPTLNNADYLIVNRLRYRFFDPQRGDIVVFKDPLEQHEYDVKRVVGLPGDQFRIVQNHVVVQPAGQQEEITLPELYLDSSVVTISGSQKLPITLGPDQYFVMGDNRTHSVDSREFGPVMRSAFIGHMQWKL